MPTPRRRSRRAVVVVTLGVLLLVATVGVAWQVQGQATTLAQRVSTTQDLVDANVRTLSQAQRELLRLDVLLATGAPGQRIDTQVAFVTQRARESALDYQLRTLGAEDLLDIARDNQRLWTDRALPLVRTAVRSRAPDDVRQARRSIEALERSYNYLVSEGEISRRRQAAVANEETRGLVRGTEQQLIWVVALMLVALMTLGAGGVTLVRLDRARAAATSRLESANEGLLWYARIVQATSSMLLVTDTDGSVRWSNDRYQDFVGINRAALTGLDIRQLLASGDRDEQESLEDALLRAQPTRVELQLRDSSGAETWVSVAMSPDLSAAGEARAYVFVLEDVTERHTAETMLHSAREAAEDSARTKASFLATMSHEIRTPLNAVLGLTDLLLQTELDDDQRDYVGTAKQSGKHLLDLLNDILDFSALESGRLQYDSAPVSLQDLLDSTIAMFGPQVEDRGLFLVQERDPKLPERVRGDSVRLRQVLVNLVGNAIKFTEKGGATVASRVVERSAGACTVEICVTDTGIGVPSSRIPQLFQSFVRGDATSTRKYGGTGLGLAICRGLVEGMNGTIDLASEEGSGTSVTMRVPFVLVQEPAPRNPGAVQELGDFSHLRVLVAEDEPINRLVVTKMLARLGITPEMVGDGEEAVAAVAASHFDVVLMDVQMPTMDGVRATQLIGDLDLQHAPRVIALTANALGGDRQRFIDAGMHDYVSKPMTIDALADALDRAQRARKPQQVL